MVLFALLGCGQSSTHSPDSAHADPHAAPATHHGTVSDTPAHTAPAVAAHAHGTEDPQGTVGADAVDAAHAVADAEPHAEEGAHAPHPTTHEGHEPPATEVPQDGHAEPTHASPAVVSPPPVHPVPAHAAPVEQDVDPAPAVQQAAPATPAADARIAGQALRSALMRVVLGFGLVLGVGLLASTATRRLPQLRTEIFRTRFVATVLLIGWTALTAVSGVQRGGSVASLGSLATIVVVTTGYGLWWVPRYLDGLWVVLTANRRRLPIECNGIQGTLADVGPLRAVLIDAHGSASSVPISSFGGAIVRSGLERRVRLEFTPPGDPEQARLRAIISPFRDPTEPVLLDRKTGVLTVRCWEEGAASCLEAELLSLTS